MKYGKVLVSLPENEKIAFFMFEEILYTLFKNKQEILRFAQN
jgi:hypothetical protein